VTHPNQHTDSSRKKVLLDRLHKLALAIHRDGQGQTHCELAALWGLSVCTVSRTIYHLELTYGWAAREFGVPRSLSVTLAGLEALEVSGRPVPAGALDGPEARLLARECGATWAAELVGESVARVKAWAKHGTPLGVRERFDEALRRWQAGEAPMGPEMPERMGWRLVG